MNAGKGAFVTVGTTEFDQLIMSVTSPDVRKVLRGKGYSSMLLQIGRGNFEPEVVPASPDSPSVDFYRYKDSVAKDIQNADLVISHAGAGSVLESLTLGRPLVVVVNDKLMNNHQIELARRLNKDGYLHYCICSTLAATLEDVDVSSLRPLPPGNPTVFAEYLDSVMGFT
ncbi:hypothetical protein BaRGS_00010937 [Batillaria attramentaria]|uniref:UDP-N-acetylglucosamine transferase subunit ALG13 n=1 Tax=Batillaria attramentaria TaxID=370345 RepID=A0ABD0LEX8_9CAEN